MDIKDIKKDLEECDIKYVNKNLMLTRNIPAYTIAFFILYLITVFIDNSLMVLFITFVIYIMFKAAIVYEREGVSFRTFIDEIKYIFKPRFYLLKEEKNEKNSSN